MPETSLPDLVRKMVKYDIENENYGGKEIWF
jgi:hypothetical protein